jgi:hypothetical protein
MILELGFIMSRWFPVASEEVQPDKTIDAWFSTISVFFFISPCHKLQSAWFSIIDANVLMNL